MKRILLFLCINLFFLSCKENYKLSVENKTISNIESIGRTAAKKEIQNHTISVSSKNQTCKQLLDDLVKTSSLKSPFKESLVAEIENLDAETLKIMLYEDNNVVGNLVLDAKNSKLLDITNDNENPEDLKFDVKKWNIIIDCYFEKNKKYYIDYPNNNDCKTNQIEMGLEEICTIKNSTIKDVYIDLIKNKLVDKTENLQENLPLKTEKIKINSDGLISISYLVDINKVKIDMLFDGGVTTILLEQKGSNVKRIITNSAD